MLTFLTVKMNDEKGTLAKMPFIIRFEHSPANKGYTDYVAGNGKTKRKYKEHRQRTCTCYISAITPLKSEVFPSMEVNIPALNSDSNTKTFETEIKTATAVFRKMKGVSYCKAFGRHSSLQQALRSLILDGRIGDLPYTFTNETFKEAVAAVRKTHFRGVKCADELQRFYNAF